jgi:mannose-6-phosphate isomerase-like protein (cupin superfamily)
MKDPVLRLNLGAEFFTSELCYITELLNSAADSHLSIARARVPVGNATRWHRLKDTAERYVILEGRGCVEVGDFPAQEVSAGDVVLIAPMDRQRITNVGENELIFLAICTPRFRPENYEDLESPGSPTTAQPVRGSSD